MSLSVIITLKIPVILNSLKRNSKGIPSRDIKVKQISDKLVKSQHATHTNQSYQQEGAQCNLGNELLLDLMHLPQNQFSLLALKNMCLQ